MQVECIGFGKIYPSLTLKKYKTDYTKYKALLLVFQLQYLKKGYKLYRANKPNKNGTKVSFKKITDENDFLLTLQNIEKKISEIKDSP